MLILKSPNSSFEDVEEDLSILEELTLSTTSKITAQQLPQENSFTVKIDSLQPSLETVPEVFSILDLKDSDPYTLFKEHGLPVVSGSQEEFFFNTHILPFQHTLSLMKDTSLFFVTYNLGKTLLLFCPKTSIFTLLSKNINAFEVSHVF